MQKFTDFLNWATARRLFAFRRCEVPVGISILPCGCERPKDGKLWVCQAGAKWHCVIGPDREPNYDHVLLDNSAKLMAGDRTGKNFGDHHRTFAL